jgi:hypothetical protein
MLQTTFRTIRTVLRPMNVPFDRASHGVQVEMGKAEERQSDWTRHPSARQGHRRGRPKGKEASVTGAWLVPAAGSLSPGG